MTPLLDRIRSRQAVVGIVGMGYVGLPLARAFCNAGVRVIGYDIDAAKVASLRDGRGYIKHFGDEVVGAMVATGRFDATDQMTALRAADAILICVPTPLGKHLEPDLSYVERTSDALAAVLRPGQLIILESTTYPGTTREVVLPRLQRTGLPLGRDDGFLLAFSPEREDPGRTDRTTVTIPKVVGGIDAPSGIAAAALYRLAVQEVVEVSTAEVAEASKLLENIYRAVNIAMVNEMKLVLAAMGIDIWEVIEAAKTKPFGFQAFYPGPGLGGHCIPIDPYYLTWKAREVGMPTRFIELAGEVNHAMPVHVVRRLTLALNDRGKAVKSSRVLVLGLAYKKDVDDVRESPALEIIEALRDLGAHVDYNDPHVPRTHQMRKYDLRMESIALTAAAVSSYDAVVIATDHSAYDWPWLGEHARLIIDTRNAMGAVKSPKAAVVKA